jgi:exonuclease SbcC
MRILAIRGQNLASLAHSFEIDLTEEPLAGTGLFAITGETGAGKSTILDALCLALYGNYPRAAVDKREKIIDPSEIAVQVSDPRNILTRGAGEGFAEVDFVGVDGTAYRATWTVRRARSKAVGRLQNVERKLERCDGTLTLATGIEPVNSAVIEKTGFTFEEFRRSVLLAQGEFDAFLLADETQRAALLEKITGTEVYSRISKKVFEETSAREADLKMLAADRDRIGLRTDADVAADAAREAAVLESHAQAEAELAGITEILTRASTLSQLRQAATDRSREAAETQQAMDEAAGLHAKLEAARSEQATAAQVVDAEIADLEPLWQDAALLDARIDDAVSRRSEAAGALDDAERAEAAATENLQRLQRDKLDADKQLRQVQEALDRDAAHAALAEAEPRVSAALAGYSDLRQRVGAEADTGQRAAAEIERLTTAIRDTQTDLDKDRDDRAKLAQGIDERSAALAAMDDAALSERETRLLAADADIGRALEVVRDRDCADALLTSARQQIDTASVERKIQSERVATARADFEQRARARAELAQLSDLADAALSQHAAQMRSVLVDGEPCPVCGAADHPFAHGEDAASQLAEGIRSRRAALDQEIATLTKALNEAEAARSRAEGQERQARETVTEAEPAQERARAKLSSMLPDLKNRLAATIPQLAFSGTEAALTPEDLESLRAACVGEREGVVEARRKVRMLADEIEQLRQADAGYAKRIDEAVARREEMRQSLSALEKEAAARAERIDGWTKQADQVRGEMLPLLAPAGITSADLDGDVRVVQRRVTTVAKAYRSLLSERDAASERLVKLATDIGLAEKDASHSTTHRERLARELAQRHEEAETVRAKRAGLLGGAETRSHRQAALDRQKRARESVRAAVDEAARAGLALARAQTARDTALKRQQEAAARVEEAVTQLAEVASRAGADGAATAAIVAGVADGLASYSARQDELKKSIQDAMAALVLIRDARERDAEARRRAAAMAEEIAGKQNELEVWQAVNAAVGQADGAKFRRFAQSVTLAQLIELANVQLAALNPRYRLGRGALSDLALDVVDRDMGEEIRSPRSLSGGERFLVSLALALALSGLEGRQSFVDTLFIDEGFGSLDGETLDVAVSALESLQGQGRKVGVITHVAAMVEQIAVQVRVEKRGSGRSAVRIVDVGGLPA